MTGSVSEVTKIRESGRTLILPRMKARDRNSFSSSGTRNLLASSAVCMVGHVV